jgi:hypothetical protein
MYAGLSRDNHVFQGLYDMIFWVVEGSYRMTSTTIRLTLAGHASTTGEDLYVGICLRNFVDFMVFERTSFVLRFGDFVKIERVDFSLIKL